MTGGLASRRQSGCRRPDRMLALYREAYRGWNVKHFHEHLRRDYGFRWRYTWVKTQLHAAGHYHRHGAAGAREVMQQLDQLRSGLGAATLDEARGLEGAASAA